MLGSKASILLAGALALSFVASAAQAQNRNHARDKQAEPLLERLVDQTDRFTANARSVIGQSRFDKLEALIFEFEAARDHLHERVEKRKAEPADVERSLGRAARVQTSLGNYQLPADTLNEWKAAQETLNELARLFNVNWDWNAENSLQSFPLWYVARCLESRVDDFEKSLDQALDHSPLDGTDIEAEIADLADEMEKEIDRWRDRSAGNREAKPTPSEVEYLFKIAVKLDAFMRSRPLTVRAYRDWLQVKVNLDELARLYKPIPVWAQWD